MSFLTVNESFLNINQFNSHVELEHHLSSELNKLSVVEYCINTTNAHEGTLFFLTSDLVEGDGLLEIPIICAGVTNQVGKILHTRTCRLRSFAVKSMRISLIDAQTMQQINNAAANSYVLLKFENGSNRK